MDKENIQFHYSRLSDVFDNLWIYSDQFVSFMTAQIIKYLDLRTTDRLVDLGCGTGIYAKSIAQSLLLTTPIYCVDASADMLARVPSDPALHPIHIDASNFLVQYKGFNKVLIKDMIHHVAARDTLFQQLFATLATNGHVLIIMLPVKIKYPLFAAALARFELQQPHYKTVAHELSLVGFTVNIDRITYPLAIHQDIYLNMVAQRYMSILSEFDDDELESGLEELKLLYRDTPVLNFEDQLVVIHGYK